MARRDEGASGITQRDRVKTDLFASRDGAMVDASGNVIGLTAAELAATRAMVSGAGIAFSAFPSAASAGNGALQWESTFGMLLRSDGTYWRPAGGQQLLSRLAAEWQMAVNSSLQVCDSITIPAGMWAPGCELLMRLGANKAGGTSDTLTLRLKAAGQILAAPLIATTATGAGGHFLIKRQSATSVQQAGGSNNSSWTQLAGSVTTARSSAATVASLDANDTVVELSGQMTTGSAEYGIVNTYSLWLIG